MKIVFLVLFCFIFSSYAFAQVEDIRPDTKVMIEEIMLARDDGRGEAGETTDKFLTTDVPIYCIVQLNSLKAATVKMILVAVKATGLKPETKSVSVSYTTNGNQNRVNFNASPDGFWAAGVYRIDLFIDGRFAKSHNFEIVKSSDETAPQKRLTPESFTPGKSTKKPRKTKSRTNLNDYQTAQAQTIR